MQNHIMEFMPAHVGIPRGVLTSTARMGRKWFNKVKPGDTLEMRTTDTWRHIGHAKVVGVEYVTYSEVIARADENMVAHKPGADRESLTSALCQELSAAYGEGYTQEAYTIVHFILPLHAYKAIPADALKAPPAPSGFAEIISDALASQEAERPYTADERHAHIVRGMALMAAATICGARDIMGIERKAVELAHELEEFIFEAVTA